MFSVKVTRRERKLTPRLALRPSLRELVGVIVLIYYVSAILSQFPQAKI